MCGQCVPCLMRVTFAEVKAKSLREWSSITGKAGGGGYKTGGRGKQVKFPCNKRERVGVEQVLAMLKLGHETFSGTFNMGA